MFRVVLTSLHRLTEIWLAHYPALHGPWAHIEKTRQIHAGCAERDQLARLRGVFRPVCGGLARSSGRGNFVSFIGVKIRLGVTDGLILMRLGAACHDNLALSPPRAPRAIVLPAN